MRSIISIASHKGGVGKTAITLNLGVSLALAGHKVLLIDGDPQGNLSMSVDMKKRSNAGLYQVIGKEAQRDDIVVDAARLPLSMIHLGLDDPAEIFSLTFRTGMKRLAALGKLVNAIANQYDVTLIDTANTIGSLNSTLISCADSVIIPITCKSNSVKSLPLLLKLLAKIKNEVNPNIALLGLVPAMLDTGNPYEIEALSILRETFPRGTFFSTFIPHSTLLEKAEAGAVPVAFLPEAQQLNQSYDNLSREIMQRLKNTLKGSEHNEQPEKLF